MQKLTKKMKKQMLDEDVSYIEERTHGLIERGEIIIKLTALEMTPDEIIRQFYDENALAIDILQTFESGVRGDY